MVASWYDSGTRLTAPVKGGAEVVPGGDTWPMLGGVNTNHRYAGPWPKDASRPWLDEAEWPKRPPSPPPPPVDLLLRPLEITLTDEQVAAFGGSQTRPLTYPSFDEEMQILKAKTAEREAAKAEAVAEISRLQASMTKTQVELDALGEALSLILKAQAAAPKEEEGVAKSVSTTASAKKQDQSGPNNNAVIGGGLAAAIAAAAAYYYTVADTVTGAAGLS